MCYEVRCSSCAKRSWSGCGRHVKSVYSKIPQGQHCTCKDWPGVDLGSSAATIAVGSNQKSASESSSTCRIS